MTTDILDLIDSAVADYELSPDAMRWEPMPATPGLPNWQCPCKPCQARPAIDIIRDARWAGTLSGLSRKEYRRRWREHFEALDGHMRYRVRLSIMRAAYGHRRGHR